MRPLALLERKARLKALLAKRRNASIRYVDHLDADGRAVFQSACEMKLEGIVSKRADAAYRSGKAGSWTKTKCRQRQALVVAGWEGSAGDISLLLGARRAGRFVYVGNVGTGFNARNLPPLQAELQRLATDKRSFAVGEGPKNSRSIHWTAPELVADIEFQEWTRGGTLRHPSYKGLLPDMRANDIELLESADD